MTLKKLKLALGRLKDLLIKRSYFADKDKSEFRLRTYEAQIFSSIKTLEDFMWDVVSDVPSKDTRLELFTLLDNMKKTKDIRTILMIISRIESILGEIKEKDELNFNISKIPADLKEDMVADLDELKRCYEAKCYRSCIILCGRVIEVALHRKYFDVTGNDLLEKSPGIGLGNIIAKLSEKEIPLDPGLTQQIHLINNVRISSVHKKKEVFRPTKAQTNAIILFTLDTLDKLFKE